MSLIELNDAQIRKITLSSSSMPPVKGMKRLKEVIPGQVRRDRSQQSNNLLETLRTLALPVIP